MDNNTPSDPREEALKRAQAQLEKTLDAAIAKRQSQDAVRQREERRQKKPEKQHDDSHRAGTAVVGGDMLPRRRVIVPKKDEYVLAERGKLHEINKARRNVIGAVAAGASAAMIGTAPIAFATFGDVTATPPVATAGEAQWSTIVFFVSIGVAVVAMVMWFIKERTEGSVIEEVLSGAIYDYDEVNKRLIPVRPFAEDSGDRAPPK